ncbi:MFS transporter [Bradyrhizobium sp. CSA112]|uniref:MFS transporter n=1 Tax=Bradyrhizobium sp. CSA112 TaxID=2699170 RepID=UPI0023B15199|nr:MFS transporter [Bradyrhizobium sp. CSA112]
MRISAPVAYILLYTALYAAFGVASPFWPRFFETRGLSPQEIGIVLAAAKVTRLLAGPTLGCLQIEQVRCALLSQFVLHWPPHGPPLYCGCTRSRCCFS